MRCEVIAVGTELLLGQIVDTNSSWIGGKLALAGIDSHFQTKVGDNRARMVESIRHALSRSDAVILCGGLGPTQDDITREAIAEVMNTRLVRHDKIVRHLQDVFEKRGRDMAPSNLRQADVPDGATTIEQMPGTAPGLICPIGEQVIYAVPGVPHEMRAMLEGTVLPDLKRRAGVTAVIKSRVLKTWGYSESGLADLLSDRIAELDRSGSATLAFQASGIEGIKLRITAKAEDEPTADAFLAEEEAKVRGLLGHYIFGFDDQTMESVVLDLLKERRLTLAVAEELTGGLAGMRLAATPGSETVFQGSLLTRQPDLRASLYGLPSSAPLISAQAAMTLAEGVLDRLSADIGIAASGVAGPEEQEGQTAGTVWLAVAARKTEAAGGTGPAGISAKVMLPGDGERVRQYAVISLLNLLRRHLLGLGPPTTF